MTGFLCLGVAYGVLMQSKGYGPLWSVLMSAIAYGGSMQFVAITLLTTAFDPSRPFCCPSWSTPGICFTG